jgi:hypothetical protein
MSVTTRPYINGGWEADIRVVLPTARWFVCDWPMRGAEVRGTAIAMFDQTGIEIAGRADVQRVIGAA